jgi:hypothetical protein
MTIPSHLSFASVVEEGVPTAKEERRTPKIHVLAEAPLRAYTKT